MRSSPDSFLPIAVWSVAVFGRDPARGEAIARIMTGRDRPVDIRGAGHVQLAHLALAQGRWADARSQLDTAAALGDPDAMETRAWIAALPFSGTGDAELDSMRGALRARAAGPVAVSEQPSSFFSAQNGVHPQVNLYLRGVLAARSGDLAEAQRLADSLDVSAGTEGARELARQLATGVRAQRALAEHDTAAALTLLSDLRIEGWYELTFVSPWYAGALERYTLAELLLAAGRPEEALRWYQGLRENTVAELAFAGPSLLREAAIDRQAGRTREAAPLESQFERLWSNADGSFRDTIRTRYARAGR